MLLHCVFVRFRADVGDDDKRSIYRRLAALQHVIPGFEHITFGPNVNPEGLSQGFDDGFVIGFTDAVARDAYLVHPDHAAAGADLVALVEDGLGGMVVVDLG